MLALKELGDRASRRGVSYVLKAVDLDSVLTAFLFSPKRTDRRLELRYRLGEEIRQLTRRSRYGLDSVQVHRVGDLFDIVEDVVEPGGKGGDILVVEGG